MGAQCNKKLACAVVPADLCAEYRNAHLQNFQLNHPFFMIFFICCGGTQQTGEHD